MIRRVAADISSYNPQSYRISVVSGRADGKLRFHLGEPIKVRWSSPSYHSKRDWIGIYRVSTLFGIRSFVFVDHDHDQVGANKTAAVTNVSSLGTWVPVHDDEWDGDIPVGFDDTRKVDEAGVVTFKGDTLPWQVGTYEVSVSREIL